jgi:hypothetical protein
MNIIELISERILSWLEKQFPNGFRPGRSRSRRVEVQLEFPWAGKR